MKTKVEIKERTGYGIIVIELTNGNRYELTVTDGVDEIQVRCVEGAIAILPNVSNSIIIKTR